MARVGIEPTDKGFADPAFITLTSNVYARLLLVAEGAKGIEAGGAARGNIAGSGAYE